MQSSGTLNFSYDSAFGISVTVYLYKLLTNYRVFGFSSVGVYIEGKPNPDLKKHINPQHLQLISLADDELRIPFQAKSVRRYPRAVTGGGASKQ